MAIKLAFSNVACPDWTLEKTVEQAKAMGYQGVELRTLGPGSAGLASDPALTEAKKAKSIFAAAGIEPVCLSTSVSIHRHDATSIHNHRTAVELYLQQAADLGCERVRVFGYEVAPGQARQDVVQSIAEQGITLVERGAELGVQLLFENAGSFSLAKEWWWILNIIDHPMAGILWNVANAAASGESPAVSVPMLNSRIRLVKVKDTVVGEGSGYVPLGEGTVGIEHFLKRLMGIGYSGYISVEWDRLWLPALKPAEEYLPDARTRLQGWMDAIAEAQSGTGGKKGKAAAAKAAAAAAH